MTARPCLSLPEALYERMLDYAEAHDCSLASIIERALSPVLGRLPTRKRSYDTQVDAMRKRRDANRAAGRCLNDNARGTHGAATHGRLCERCRDTHRDGCRFEQPPATHTLRARVLAQVNHEKCTDELAAVFGAENWRQALSALVRDGHVEASGHRRHRTYRAKAAQREAA